MHNAGTLDSEIEKVLSFYADVSTTIKIDLQDGEQSFDHFQDAVMDSQELDTIHKLHRLETKIEELQAVAKRITDLLQYVSLNMQGIRKILKKFAKHVDPTKPSPGFLALEIQHPHEPGWKMMQVRNLSIHRGATSSNAAS
jgi:SPX domain protein involved in polyphosphate accumulation